MRQHNYLKRLQRAVEREVIEPGDLADVDISHDDDCGVFVGKACGCDPDIHVTLLDCEGRRKSFLIGSNGELVAEAN